MKVRYTLIVMLFGIIIYTAGFVVSLFMARHEIDEELDKNMSAQIETIQTYVDGQLQRIEDVSYSFLSAYFGGTQRTNEGKAVVEIDPTCFTIPNEDDVFIQLERFLDANPEACGVAIGFEQFVYPNTKDKYGFAAYVTNVSGQNRHLSLGNIHDFHQKEWYREAARTNKPYWSHPFRETSMGKVVTCFSIPLHGYGGRLIGVMAVDINTESFREKCSKVAPYPNSEVTILDRNFRFVSHPDTVNILKTVGEVGTYKDYKADDSMHIKMEMNMRGRYTIDQGDGTDSEFFFAPIKRNGWLVTIECPSEEVYEDIDKMKLYTSIIAFISISLMVLLFRWLYGHIAEAASKAAGVESELHVASGIQMGMLQKEQPALPQVPEIDIHGFIKPAKSVGGDLFDYVERDGKVFFCIGDVSGKGIPASLFMTVILALFRNISMSVDEPAKIMSNLNKTLSHGNSQNMFCTLFIGVLDIKSGTLNYCNGGHNAPVIRHLTDDGTLSTAYMEVQSNIAVGLIEDFPYQPETIVLNPGEALFLYTDGVTEAEDQQHRLFGEDALLQHLTEGRSKGITTAKGFVEHIYHSVSTHATGTEQSDDITMLAIEYKG